MAMMHDDLHASQNLDSSTNKVNRNGNDLELDGNINEFNDDNVIINNNDYNLLDETDIINDENIATDLDVFFDQFDYLTPQFKGELLKLGTTFDKLLIMSEEEIQNYAKISPKLATDVILLVKALNEYKTLHGNNNMNPLNAAAFLTSISNQNNGSVNNYNIIENNNDGDDNDSNCNNGVNMNNNYKGNTLFQILTDIEMRTRKQGNYNFVLLWLLFFILKVFTLVLAHLRDENSIYSLQWITLLCLFVFSFCSLIYYFTRGYYHVSLIKSIIYTLLFYPISFCIFLCLVFFRFVLLIWFEPILIACKCKSNINCACCCNCSNSTAKQLKRNINKNINIGHYNYKYYRNVGDDYNVFETVFENKGYSILFLWLLLIITNVSTGITAYGILVSSDTYYIYGWILIAGKFFIDYTIIVFGFYKGCNMRIAKALVVGFNGFIALTFAYIPLLIPALIIAAIVACFKKFCYYNPNATERNHMSFENAEQLL